MGELASDAAKLEACAAAIQDLDANNADEVAGSCGVDAEARRAFLEADTAYHETVLAELERIDVRYLTLVAGGDYGSVPDVAFVTHRGNHHFFAISGGHRTGSTEENGQSRLEFRYYLEGLTARMDPPGGGDDDHRLYSFDGRATFGVSRVARDSRAFFGLGGVFGYHACDRVSGSGADRADGCFAVAPDDFEDTGTTFSIAIDLSLPGMQGIGFARQLDLGLTIPVSPDPSGVVVTFGSAIASL